jgi:phage tail P2-like protein
VTDYTISASLAGAGSIVTGGTGIITGLQLQYKFEDVTAAPNLLLHLDNDVTDAAGRHVPTQTRVGFTTSQSLSGSAAVFSSAGGGSWINIADNMGDFTWDGDFTIDLWFYPLGFSHGINLFNLGNNWLNLYSSSNVLIVYSNDGVLIQGTTALAASTWYHVVLTRSGSYVRLYLNDVLEGSPAPYGVTLTPTAPVYIGASYAGSQLTDGYIDEIRITKGYGSTVADSSGNNYNGTLAGYNWPTSSPGRGGQVMTFSGTSGRVNVPGFAVGLSSPTGSFSIMAWIKSTNLSNIMFGGRNSGNGQAILSLLTDFNGADNSYTGYASIIVRGNGDNWPATCNGTTPLNDNVWHHVCAVFDGSPGIGSQQLYMYVDGALQTGPVTAPLQSGITLDSLGANIGYEYLNTWTTTGSIDDFRFYNKALLANEVSAIYLGTGAGPNVLSQVMGGRATWLGAGAATAPLQQRLTSKATWAGAGAVNNQIRLNIRAAAAWGGLGSLPAVPAQKAGALLSANFAGAGNWLPAVRQRLTAGALLGGSVSNLTVNTRAIFRPQTLLAGAGTADLSLGQIQTNVTASWGGSGGVGLAPDQFHGQALLAGAGSLRAWLDWAGSDNINPGIVDNAGEQLLYRNASGLEKSLATVDAYRLTVTYAELVKDQWDPWRISYRNLGYLAWAQGVNLWEDDWDEMFRRWWVANQWTFKYYRGSDLGLKMAVEAVNGKIVRLTRPPALFYPGAALTEAERLAYVARFPQLRLYPYAPRPQLPWLNYLGGVTYKGGPPHYVHNGRFFGPLRKFYPTNFNAGGQYLRACTVFEPRTGLETQCTVRRVYGVLAGHQKPIYYDEITLPARHDNHFYPGADNKYYLLPKNYPLNHTRRHAVVLGALDATAERLVRVPRDGSLDITQWQAIFQTIVPDLNPLKVRPEWVYVKHPWHKYQFYCNRTIGRKRYLVKSDAWMYLYERWYLFDPTRLPDYRTANTYMGRSRFGIRKYSAEAKIAAFWHWPKRYSYYGGFMGPGRFFAPQNTKRIEQLHRAVTASMAARDTIAINTRVKRQIQIRDVTLLDGRFAAGQWITDSS